MSGEKIDLDAVRAARDKLQELARSNPELVGASTVDGWLAALQEQEIMTAQKITAFLAAYATATGSVATTGGALLSAPQVPPQMYAEIVSRQLQTLPSALGVYMMFSPDSATVICATPVGSCATVATASDTRSKRANAALATSALASPPTRATSSTWAPARCAATAWFAPLPPSATRKPLACTVSPGRGKSRT